jgi:hypothetical protein
MGVFTGCRAQDNLITSDPKDTPALKDSDHTSSRSSKRPYQQLVSPQGDKIKVLVSQSWEPARLFLVPGKRLLLLICLSSLFLDGNWKEAFFG